MRLKELQIKEDATAGATASGNIATVVNPHIANPSRKSVAYTGTPGVSGKGPVKQYVAKKQKPTDNALDGDKLLMSSKEPQMIRRQIKEGSLYEESLLEYTKSGLCRQCLAMVEAGVETMETCKQHCEHLATTEPEEEDSPWWKFWDDANIPRTEREAIGIIQEAMKMRNEGLSIEKRLPDWRKKANQEAGGITDIEKAAGASKPTNQGQTDVEKSTIADVDRTTLHVEKPKKKIARAPQLGRDA